MGLYITFCFITEKSYVGSCSSNDEWTIWFNSGYSETFGDYESPMRIRSKNKETTCRNPQAIEARMVNGRPAKHSANMLKISVSGGLQCSNKKQPRGSKCKDFEVRFCCSNGENLLLFLLLIIL